MQLGGKYLNRQFQNCKMRNKSTSTFLVVSKGICGWIMARGPVLLRLRDTSLFWGVCVFGCGGGGEYHITGRLEPWVWSSGTQVLASVLWAEAK